MASRPSIRSLIVDAQDLAPQRRTEIKNAWYIFILVLMRRLRKTGFDRRHMAPADLEMRDVIILVDDPLCVIIDPN